MVQPPSPERSGERIAKLLARAGVASRREVERMSADGRVKLNDQVLTTPATVLPNLKGVTVDDKAVKAAEAARLFLFHKPAGLLTAERDHSGRPTIYTALRNALPQGTARMMPVGRLDFNTEGLLLLTNDGELKRAMELPSSGIPRTYRARTFGTVTQEQLEDLSDGIEIDGIRYGSINANMERSAGRNQWIEVTITEGKNREVRRVLEHLGLEVSRLIRIAYGPFHLLDLPRGAAVEIRPQDVEKFVKALSGGNPNEIAGLTMKAQAAPVREPRVLAEPEKPRPKPGKFSPSGGGGRREAADGRGADAEKRRAPPHPLRQPAQRAVHPERPAFRPAEGAATSPKGRGLERPGHTEPSSPTGRRAARGENSVDTRRAAAADRRTSPKPPRKADDRDRGEKLLDRPKEHRKPSGWAKAKAPRRPGKPGGKGPNTPRQGK
jgi:23S rRNA pseudouridine2605 synthase